MSSAKAFHSDPELIKEFQDQSLEDLDGVERQILAFRADGRAQDLIQEIFRSIHTIKGSAAYLGFAATKRLAHTFENVLDQMRKQPRRAESLHDQDVLVTFLKVIDFLRLLVKDPAAEANVEASPEYHSVLRALEGFASADDARASEVKPAVVLPQTATTGSETTKAPSSFDKLLNQQRERIEHALASSPPQLASAERALRTLARAIAQGKSEQTRAWTAPIENALKLLNEATTAASKVHALRAFTDLFHRPPEPESVAAPVSSASERKTIRVDERLIDDLMTLVGELIVTRNSLSHWQSRLPERAVEDSHFRLLKEINHRLNHVATEMQSSVAQARWVPIGVLFNRMQRLVLDLSHQTGKPVRLVTSGEDSGIDRTLVEFLNEPLVHLIRNAVDHGIESSEARRAAGKPECGTLTLSARQEGDRLLVQLHDDGKGIDVDLVARRAIERGLISSEKRLQMTDAELTNLVFAPGFSTAAAVTEISGRGVGMDAVLHGLKKVNGSVKLTTDPGQGTTVTLELPLSLAVTEALLVASGRDIFAIPLRSVLEIVKIDRAAMGTMIDQALFHLRGQVLAVQNLREALNIAYDEGRTEDRLTALIIQSNAQSRALLVDRVVRKEEIVIKPLQAGTSSHKAVTGAAVMGDGSAILVVDPSYL